MAQGNVVLNLTAVELSTLLDHLKVGGVPNAPNFKYEQTAEGLLLKQEGKTIARQNINGTWIVESVSTGVGSFHLGGDTGLPVHSISSVGQNIGFKNEAFNAVPEQATVWFPPWQGLSANLDTVITPTYLEFGVVQTAFAPNGVETAGVVAYNFHTVIPANLCVAEVTVRSAEAYTGKVKNVIKSTVTNVLLHEAATQVTVAAGGLVTVKYPSLYFARAGDALTLILEKEDGSPLSVRAGTTNTNQPWRTLRVRSYVDKPITALKAPTQISGAVTATVDTVSRMVEYHADVTSAAVPVTLPAAPVKGDMVAVTHVAGNLTTKLLTVRRNGKKIQGLAEDLTIDITDASVRLVYNGAEWRVFIRG